LPEIRPAFGVACMVDMPAVSTVEQVKKWAGEKEQPGQGAEEMSPVLS